MLRPSDDLAEIAAEYEERLPRMIRYPARGLGTREARSGDLLSALLFESAYTRRLIECGRRDAQRRLGEILEFVSGAEVSTEWHT